MGVDVMPSHQELAVDIQQTTGAGLRTGKTVEGTAAARLLQEQTKRAVVAIRGDSAGFVDKLTRASLGIFDSPVMAH